jgi:hypothetical protein
MISESVYGIEWKKGIVKPKGSTVDELCEAIKKILDNNAEEFDCNGFYVFICSDMIEKPLKNYKILYIGLTYDQLLNVRPAQKSGHESAYNEILRQAQKKTLYIMLGKPKEEYDEEAFENIEKCLIFKNKPTCNIQNANTSNCTCNISIENTGYYGPLEKNSKC